jgi:hypothetical protein
MIVGKLNMARSTWLPVNKACTPFRNNLSQSTTHVAIITTNYLLTFVLSESVPAFAASNHNVCNDNQALRLGSP